MRYKYLTIEEDVEIEFWACDVCRKQNNPLILVGKWRLIDKIPSDIITCDKCSADEVVCGADT